ncbi:MAG: multicopper oxidase domain-containing protein [Gammaproteobacteria bacterium]|nr:multicopper oxidase domain-containing protein [Gammaproteobacteria bacterium]
MITRRGFLKLTAAATGGICLYSKFGLPALAYAAIPGGTLDPTTIAKYQMPLFIPPAMPRSGEIKTQNGLDADYYEIAVRQFQQQILPAGMPTTTVWGYGSILQPSSFHYPTNSIEAMWGKPVRIKWINDLKDPVTGHYLPHLLAVDPTLHWANPPGGDMGRDMRPSFKDTPAAYTGPVPLVTHLHGGHTSQESDGYPEAWFLPAASNIPEGYATQGSRYDSFKTQFQTQQGVTWEAGTVVFQYPNDQRACTLWFHDHTLGMTRLNLYAGPVGFYLVRDGSGDVEDGVLPGPAPQWGDNPKDKNYHEIPILIQDRAFNSDGSLFYPDNRIFFDQFSGPYIPDSDISPIWNPEFFANTIVVNGHTWPYLEVEPRRYRLRIVNGCNSRFLILKLDDPTLPLWQIGSDGALLPAPVQLTKLLLAPAERADIIIDFTELSPGAEVILQNIGPDAPFGGGTPGVDFVSADPDTTGQVMQFRVVPLTGVDNSSPPNQLKLPKLRDLGPASKTRQISLNEAESNLLLGVGPRQAQLGTVDAGAGTPLLWMDPITENPALDATEVWEIHNFTEDAHPIHVHEVQFQIVNRQPFGGEPRPPEHNETGLKDTVIAYPGEITRIKAKFDLAGLYVWHCHIVEHEDNEMMRPYFIGPMTP